MALTMQAVGCSSTFMSGAPLVGVRGSPSSCGRARAVSPRSSLVLPVNVVPGEKLPCVVLRLIFAVTYSESLVV